MNYIKHLTGFFEKVVRDKTINPTHVSIYISLFQFWNCNRFKNPISISRDEVMRISKVSSKGTYHKCLKNLHALEYIHYEPSFNPFKGSVVYMFDFSDNLKPLSKKEQKADSFFELPKEQVIDSKQTATKTTTELLEEQVVVSYINNTNITNNSNDSNALNANQPAENYDVENDFLKRESTQKEKKLREKKKEATAQTPELKDVITYFLELNYPEVEAKKFFNYFQSIGWLVGGRTPMSDWKAAANNWMINTAKFIANDQQYNRVKHLNTGTDKDYAEPL